MGKLNGWYLRRHFVNDYVMMIIIIIIIIIIIYLFFSNL